MPATIERTKDEAAERTAAAPVLAPRERERPVFASDTHRRARALKAIGWVLAAATALWLVALVLGAFGLRPLPEIGLPQVPGASQGSAADAERLPGDAVARELDRARSRAVTREEATAAAARREARAEERSGGSGSSSSEDSTASEEGANASESGSGNTSTPTTSTPAPSTAAPATTTGNGNSATAPGAVNRPDRTTTTDPARGNSGTAPGATRSGDRRGGPKADTTTSP
jgi:hypothetical protein